MSIVKEEAWVRTHCLKYSELISESVTRSVNDDGPWVIYRHSNDNYKEETNERNGTLFIYGITDSQDAVEPLYYKIDEKTSTLIKAATLQESQVVIDSISPQVITVYDPNPEYHHPYSITRYIPFVLDPTKGMDTESPQHTHMHIG